MTGHMQLQSGFNEAEQHVVLQINEGEKAWAHITLELPEFIEHIKKLAGLRTLFAEQVPADIDPGTRIEAINDPGWIVHAKNPGLPAGTVLLHLRHPGLGWLSFAIPAHEAKAMSETLAKAGG
jgi:hypothetical protein